MIRRMTAVLSALVMILAGVAFAAAEAPTIETDVTRIQKYGNLVLGIKAGNLLKQGYAYGDIITVTVDGQVLDMPLGSNYSDVDNKQMICRAVTDQSDADYDRVSVAIYMGDFAAKLGIRDKVTVEDDPSSPGDYKVTTPLPVTISMKEQGGYKDEYEIRQLVRTNNREDYPNLTDEQYANFRNVKTTGMGAFALYRTSSPVNPKLNRNREADEALNNAGVRTVMNLEDDEKMMKSYEGYSQSYYSQRDVIPLKMPMDFGTEEFRGKLAKGIAFFASHEGPYLVHCQEGKDRAGFVSAILECLMGATAEEVAADYMVTFYNYYGIEPGTKKYDIILKGNIEKGLCAAFGIESIYQADLAACAEKYLRGIGVEEETIRTLKEKLSKSYGD